ncbi:MAG TPA: ABC transporter ATP-binding protein [Phycisphaerae bacterium]|nr:ABC transporter ATP-binding protein [Phycisphaerae bacterium]
MPETDNILLRVSGLTTRFFTDEGVAYAVEEVSFDVPRGGTLALVGESGCGKTVTALSILRLISDPPGRIESGSVRLGGETGVRLGGETGVRLDAKELLTLSEEDMRAVRGNRIAMIFQEPMTSLNPVFTIGDQIAEAVVLHEKAGRAEAMRKAVAMLRKVGIPDPEQRVSEYPHQMSGGMRQRVMIAMALVCGPELLIADEPTTALDVTIQAQILDLLRSLRGASGMSMLMITHDLGIVAETADSVAVMYAGRIVEQADVRELFAAPLHPYTVGLFRSRPDLEPTGEPLAVIPGTVPSPLAVPPGCPFHPRCPLADDARCPNERPPLQVKKAGHLAACWHSDRLEGMRNRGEAIYRA